jgi:hypothetical protein
MNNSSFYDKDNAIEAFTNLNPTWDIDNPEATSYIAGLYDIVSNRLASQLSGQRYDQGAFANFVKWFVPVAMAWYDVRNGDIGLLSRNTDGTQIAYDKDSDPFADIDKQLKALRILDNAQITWAGGAGDNRDVDGLHGSWLVPVYSGYTWSWNPQTVSAYGRAPETETF